MEPVSIPPPEEGYAGGMSLDTAVGASGPATVPLGTVGETHDGSKLPFKDTP